METATHVQDGTIIAPSPDRGVVNSYLQHRHLSNLFILAALTFPNQGCASPTPALMVFAHQGAAALVGHYPKTPGPLA